MRIDNRRQFKVQNLLHGLTCSELEFLKRNEKGLEPEINSAMSSKLCFIE